MGAGQLNVDGSTRSGPEVRAGVCRVVCGALTAGVCLHLLAAAAAMTLAVGMVIIAIAGPAAPWVGGIVIGGSVTAIAMCVARNRT